MQSVASGFLRYAVEMLALEARGDVEIVIAQIVEFHLREVLVIGERLELGRFADAEAGGHV